MAYDHIDNDKLYMENEVDATSEEYVEKFLRTPPDHPPNIMAHLIDQLQNESAFVRSYEFRAELMDNLKSIIENIQVMYRIFNSPSSRQKSRKLAYFL